MYYRGLLFSRTQYSFIGVCILHITVELAALVLMLRSASSQVQLYTMLIFTARVAVYRGSHTTADLLDSFTQRATKLHNSLLRS